MPDNDGVRGGRHPGKAFAFDPEKPTAQSPMPVDEFHGLVGIACPAANQCTAVDQGNYALSFDPNFPRPTGALPVPIGMQGVTGIACVSTKLCIAFGRTSVAEGDPTSGSNWSIQSIAGAAALGSLACVGTRCVAVDGNGQEAYAANPGPLPSCTFSAGKPRPPRGGHKFGTTALRVGCAEAATVAITGTVIRRVGKHQRRFTVATLHASAQQNQTLSLTARVSAKAFARAKGLRLSGRFTLTATDQAGTTKVTTTSP